MRRAVANEWAGRGVQINAIASGYLRTEVTRPVYEDHRRNQAVLHRIPVPAEALEDVARGEGERPVIAGRSLSSHERPLR